jgi:hypothetical protein
MKDIGIWRLRLSTKALEKIEDNWQRYGHYPAVVMLQLIRFHDLYTLGDRLDRSALGDFHMSRYLHDH